MATQPQTASPAASRNTKYVDSINPATDEVIARFEATRPEELPPIMARAREAQREWVKQPLAHRCAMLRRLRDAIFESREEIAGIICQESGKPRVEALFAEILLTLDTTDFLARRAPRWLRRERVPHHNIALKAKSGWLEFEPLGVVAIISPWNYPFATPMVEIIPAVIAGNAVLLKPSELTPWTGWLARELFRRAHFPVGLVQVLQGAGEVGESLIEAKPDKVFFTGSVATGRRIAENCGKRLIPSVLELGGKDAMIVLKDTDLDMASSAAVWGGFMNCGQTCISVERIYVEQDIAERFTDLCVQKTKKLRLGPPADQDAEVGPMIRRKQLEKVEEQLREATAQGAQILTGGKRRPDLGPNFLEPTVVRNVTQSMALMREETFGPVIAIHPVASAAEAVELANDSPFGLGASVWTRDARRGKQVASQLRAGAVMVNDVASYYGICEAPHGGLGESGWGRTHSKMGLREMVNVKYADVDWMPRVAKSWWYGYSEELAAAADRYVEFLFAPSWKKRIAALRHSGELRRLVFRRERI
jgi:acyl-CoA reductase-like NAD-dependent aldehyde dehydrogenase